MTMHPFMRVITFYAKRNRSGNLLHIETDGCIVNIRVGLTDDQGRTVTRIDVIPDSEESGGDGHGQPWEIHPEDGNGVTRVITVPAGGRDE